MIKYFTFDQLKDFVTSQSDDRLIEDTSVQDSVGTVLIHFGRKFTKKKIALSGITGIMFDKHFLIPKTMEDRMQIQKFGENMRKYKVSNYKKAKQLV